MNTSVRTGVSAPCSGIVSNSCGLKAAGTRPANQDLCEVRFSDDGQAA